MFFVELFPKVVRLKLILVIILLSCLAVDVGEVILFSGNGYGFICS